MYSNQAIEKELVNTYRTIYDGPIIPDPSELDGGRFWSPSEILENMGKGIFTPNFERNINGYSCKLQKH